MDGIGSMVQRLWMLIPVFAKKTCTPKFAPRASFRLKTNTSDAEKREEFENQAKHAKFHSTAKCSKFENALLVGISNFGLIFRFLVLFCVGRASFQPKRCPGCQFGSACLFRQHRKV